jgi:hypothetical protein
MRCIECPADVPSPDKTAPPATQSIDPGVGGRSARERHELLVARREADLKSRWGERVGGWITKLGDEPQTTRAWAKGAVGEERLATILAELEGVRVLHDRRVPGKPWNIDHVVISLAGVFVVDAKNYGGEVRIKRRGSFFNPEDRLYVGRRDCTKAADGMNWQVDVVETVFRTAGVVPIPLVTPVLCFIGADWPLFGAASRFNDVRLESERSIKKLVTGSASLGEADVDRLHRLLAAALLPK